MVVKNRHYPRYPLQMYIDILNNWIRLTVFGNGLLRMIILWHISSHGWGHAARQRELIRVYRKRHPDTRIIVASNVPKWFWKYSQIDEIYRGSPSPVAIETHSDIDTEATRVNLSAFLGSHSALLNREIAFQDEIEPDIVITDIDPLPVAAASDVIVSKAGYGIISQILALGKPCVLLRRGSFPEEPYLLEPMRGRTATEILDQSDLHLLPEAVENVSKAPAPSPVDSDGTDFIVSGKYLAE